MNSNLEIIQNFYQAFKDHKKQEYLDACDEKIEWNVLEGFPNGGKYVGKNAVFEEYFPKMLSNFTEFHAISEEFLSFDEKVIVLGEYRGKTKTNNEFAIPFSHVYQIKDEKIIKFNQYTDTEIIQNALEKK